MKNVLFTFLPIFLFSMSLMGQTPQGRSFDQIFEDMHRQMQRGIPQQRMDTIQLKPGQNEYYQVSPDSSSYFYFKVDTTLGGSGAMQQFFRFDPFGGGNSLDQGFGMGSFDDIFKQMEEMQRQFFGFPPDNNSGTEQEEPNDGLLPEERIRLREEQGKSGQPLPQPAKPTAPAKQKIKTTRI